MRRITVWMVMAAGFWLAGCGGGTQGLVGGGAIVTADDFGRMTAGADTSATTGAVTGQALDAAGQPVPEATVTISGDGRQDDSPSFSTVCDGEGRFSIGGVPEGSFQLRFSHEGFEEIEVEVHIRAGQVAQAGGPRLEHRPGAGEGEFEGPGPVVDAGSIVGLVQDGAGNPVPGAHLSIGDRRHAETGPLGAFAFGPLAAGEYEVNCRAEHFLPAVQSAAVAAGEATRLLFILEPGESDDPPAVETATVGGTVTNGETGDALAGITVRLEGARSETTTDDQGVFLFEEVHPGGHVLIVRADGYHPWTEPIRVPPGAELRVPVAMAPRPAEDGLLRGALRVVVTDSSSTEPLAGAVVTVDDRGPFVTDDNGVVEIDGVPVGSHVVKARARQHHPARAVAVVEADQTTTVELALDPETAGDAGDQFEIRHGNGNDDGPNHD